MGRYRIPSGAIIGSLLLWGCALAAGCGGGAASKGEDSPVGGAQAATTPAMSEVTDGASPSPSDPANAPSGPAGGGAAPSVPSPGPSGPGGPSASGGPSVPPGRADAGASMPVDAAVVDASAMPRGLDCEVDPLADEQVHGSGFYEQFTGLFGCTAPADLALYRELLPAKFDMPATPEVCFYTIDFTISAVGRYHEVAILMPITYAGETGKYVLTMVLDNRAATTGGRAVGFPKYMGDVVLEQDGDDWHATAGTSGREDFGVDYAGACRAVDELQWPDFINLTPIPSSETSSEAFLPPRDGRALRIPAEYLTPPAYYSLEGEVSVRIGDHLPWNGLIDESQPFRGLLTTFKGGIDLGNQRLD